MHVIVPTPSEKETDIGFCDTLLRCKIITLTHPQTPLAFSQPHCVLFALHDYTHLYDDDDEPDGYRFGLLLGSICFTDELMAF
jgi:hypothetical protein